LGKGASEARQFECPGRGEGSGAYAQCDGGICFRRIEDTTFPGFDKPVPKGQIIICSCPITQAKTGDDAQGYQILGPYPCDKSFFGYCKAATATSKTGSTIDVGAPIGTGSGSGGPAQRQGRARQRVSGVSPISKLLHLYATWRMPGYIRPEAKPRQRMVSEPLHEALAPLAK
jgi:hypothetical protein